MIKASAPASITPPRRTQPRPRSNYATWHWALGLRGARRGTVKRTTIADPAAARAKDLVRRNFRPLAPNRLWVADFTYVSTQAGWVYAAFVIDAYARRILGWKVSASMTTDLVLDAINQAIFTRRREGVKDLSGLIHHNDYAEVDVKPENLRMACSGRAC